MLLVRGYLYLRMVRLTISGSLARALSRADQSTLRFLRRLSAISWAIFFSVSAVSSRTADSLLAVSSRIARHKSLARGLIRAS